MLIVREKFMDGQELVIKEPDYHIDVNMFNSFLKKSLQHDKYQRPIKKMEIEDADTWFNIASFDYDNPQNAFGWEPEVMEIINGYTKDRMKKQEAKTLEKAISTYRVITEMLEDLQEDLKALENLKSEVKTE